MKNTRRSMAWITPSTALSVLLAATSASAQIFPYTTVLRISVAPRPTEGTSNTIATLGQAKDGSTALIVRSFDRRTGFQQGTTYSNANFPPGVELKDVLVSVVFEPNDPRTGTQHVLVLDSGRHVHILSFGFMPDGTPFPDGSLRTIGPLGPAEAGEGTVLGEAPNPMNRDDPFLAIGTTNGEVIITTHVIEPICSPIAPGPIQDLGAIRQVGYFAFGAVSERMLYFIDPLSDLGSGALAPKVTAVLRDPRPIPLIDFSAPLLTRDSEPFIDPNVGLIAAANGTTEIATLEIPPNPSFGDALRLFATSPSNDKVIQVVLGSLTWLPFDGTGVLYNAGFTLEDGLVGRVWTIAGASMEIAPETLNLRSRGAFVTVRIEAENNRAAEIDLATLTLSVDGVAGDVPVAFVPAPALLNFDGDLNIDLEAKFDRAALIGLLGQTTGSTAVIRATWEYVDGTDGEASTQLRIVR